MAVPPTEAVPYPHAWEAYFHELLAGGGSITVDMLNSALNAVGVDPMSTPLWFRRLRLEVAFNQPERLAQLFHSALSVPQYGAAEIFQFYRRSCRELQPLTITAYEAASQRLQKEDWPAPFVNDSDVETLHCVAERRTRWSNLLKELFRQQLESGSEDPEGVPLRRIDLAFRQAMNQLKNDDAFDGECAMFRHLFLGSPSETAILTSAQASISPSAHRHGLHTAHSSWAEPKEPHLHLLWQQRQFIATLPESKKAFRELGKKAESEKIVDWRLYHQWALSEAHILRDTRMAAKVYERALLVAKETTEEHDILAAKAQTFFLGRHAEGEFTSLMEKRVQNAMKTNDENVRRAVERQLQHSERLLGVTSRREDSDELRSPSTRLASYFKVGSLQPLRHCDADPSSFSITNESETTEGGLTVADAHRRLDTGPRFAVMRPWPISFSLVTCVPFVAPPCHKAVSSSEADVDDVVGPRTLRGTAAQKLHFDNALQTRLSEKYRLDAAGGASNAQSQVTTDGIRLPSQLQHLLEQLEEVTPCSLDSAWLIRQLAARELNLAQLLK